MSTSSDDFHLSTPTLRRLAGALGRQLAEGLVEDGKMLKMIPSYVSNLPTGSEKGTFLALDLGGTNFRVCAVTLLANKRFEMHHQKYTVSEALKTSKGEDLFDFIADCVESYISSHNLSHSSKNTKLRLGFTFSFPIQQTAINSGLLMHWNKGFTCQDVVGQDVVALLEKSCKKKGVNVEVTAILNDTVGTLMAHAYPRPTTIMGVILGTGTNAAYVESLKSIPKFEKQTDSGQMIINTEWGAFDANAEVVISTKYDRQLDERSNNPGQQVFEKLISGMYLGEITRLTLVGLIQDKALLNGKLTKAIETQWAFETEYMSQIEDDQLPDLTQTETILKEKFQYTSTTREDRQLIQSIVQQVGTRSARLSAVGIFALLEKIGQPQNDEVVIGIDGTLWSKYPNYPERVTAALKELMGDKVSKVKLETAKDGSGVGAALVAALV